MNLWFADAPVSTGHHDFENMKKKFPPGSLMLDTRVDPPALSLVICWNHVQQGRIKSAWEIFVITDGVICSFFPTLALDCFLQLNDSQLIPA